MLPLEDGPLAELNILGPPFVSSDYEGSSLGVLGFFEIGRP